MKDQPINLYLDYWCGPNHPSWRSFRARTKLYSQCKCTSAKVSKHPPSPEHQSHTPRLDGKRPSKSSNLLLFVVDYTNRRGDLDCLIQSVFCLEFWMQDVPDFGGEIFTNSIILAMSHRLGSPAKESKHSLDHQLHTQNGGSPFHTRLWVWYTPAHCYGSRPSYNLGVQIILEIHRVSDEFFILNYYNE